MVSCARGDGFAAEPGMQQQAEDRRVAARRAHAVAALALALFASASAQAGDLVST